VCLSRQTRIVDCTQCYKFNNENKSNGGDGGIRTLDRPLQAYNGLANRRLQPLGHSSMSADMPDAGASRKQQFEITPLRSGHTEPCAHSARIADDPQPLLKPILVAACLLACAPHRNPPGIDSMPHAGRFHLTRIPVPATGHDAGTGWDVPDAFRLGEVSQFRHLSSAFCPPGASNVCERPATALSAMPRAYPLTLL
jgi:hypothetical protein